MNEKSVEPTNPESINRFYHLGPDNSCYRTCHFRADNEAARVPVEASKALWSEQVRPELDAARGGSGLPLPPLPDPEP